MAPRLPPFFRSLTPLRALNVVGVGLAMSAATGAIFGRLFGVGGFSNLAAAATAAPTLALGVLWALLLRWRREAWSSRRRVGWLLSVPLAIVNATLAVSLLAVQRSGQGLREVLVMFLPQTVFCAIFGLPFWGGGLLATLGAFGLPIAWSQRQASKGLAGEERGEAMVAGAVLLVSLLSLFMLVYRPASNDENWLHYSFVDIEEPRPRTSAAALRRPDSAATGGLLALGSLGAVAGATALGLALGRERRRRRFVAGVEQRTIAGYRVDDTPEGKVLVRVALGGEEAYRSVSQEEEELFALDERGLALRPLSTDERRS